MLLVILPTWGEMSPLATEGVLVISNVADHHCVMSNSDTPLWRRQLANARSLRKNMTDAEAKLWSQLRAHRLMGLSFRRQHPIGPYIADFVCAESKVVIELDGSQHAEDKAMMADERRTAFLTSRGWHVLRFWNDDVLRHLNDTCQHIWVVCNERQLANAH
jgi:very-short-patch-repair endonuclease